MMPPNFHPYIDDEFNYYFWGVIHRWAYEKSVVECNLVRIFISNKIYVYTKLSTVK